MELLEWLKGGLEIFGTAPGSGPLAEWTEFAGSAVAIVLFVTAALLLYQEFLRCVVLLRRMHANTARGGWWQVTGTVLRLALTDGALFSKDRRTLARRTRIVIEHELFNPKPQPDWREGLEDTDEEQPSQSLVASLTDGWRVRRACRNATRGWWAGMGRALALEGNWTIHVADPSLVSARIDEVELYFDCLASVGYEGWESDRFICPIEIASGFVAPLHLLTGLYRKFDENWKPILGSFDRDANGGGRTDITPTDRDLRQIQLFIYNCWLLWGPSVPICECRNWAARYAVIQYGYGDENNSVEVVGLEAEIRRSLALLMEAQVKHVRAIRTLGDQRPPLTPFTGMAAPANVLGRLRLASSLGGKDAAEVNALPKAALTSWGGTMNNRPVLFISEIVSTNAVEGDVEQQSRQRGRITADRNAYPSRYYSAYLWAAVVVLAPSDKGFLPLTRVRGERSEPWKDFIPFFEHGNLADAESCLFGKRQLATKLVQGLAASLREWGTDREPLHFAFACAIDEAGCGHDLAFPDWAGHVTLRQLIGEALDTLAPSDPVIKRMRDEKLLDLNHFGGAPGRHDFSACTFPAIIAAHYETMEEESATRRL